MSGYRKTCYLVVHQKLDAGVLKTVRVGLYSSSAYMLTNMDGELNSDVLSVEADDYGKAREDVLHSINYMADLGVDVWVALREMLPESERQRERLGEG